MRKCIVLPLQIQYSEYTTNSGAWVPSWCYNEGRLCRSEAILSRQMACFPWLTFLGDLRSADTILCHIVLMPCSLDPTVSNDNTCHLDFLFIMSLQNPQSFIKLHTVITAYILHHTTNVLGHHLRHHQHQTLSQRYVKCFLYRRYTRKIAAPRGDLGLKVLEKPSCCIAELLPDVSPT